MKCKERIQMDKAITESLRHQVLESKGNFDTWEDLEYEYPDYKNLEKLDEIAQDVTESFCNGGILVLPCEQTGNVVATHNLSKC